MKRFDFLKTLKERIVVLDGAMGTMLHAANLKAVDYGGADFGMLGDLLNISRPEEIKKVHRAYLEAGANAVETNTFGSSALRLKEYDFSKINKSAFGEFFDKRTAKVLDDYSISYLLSKKGAEIAGESLEEYSKGDSYDGRPLFVIGSIGPSNHVLSPTEADIQKGSWELVENNFYRQILGLIDGGADVILFETQQDILEIKAAVAGAFKAMKERSKKLPVMVQVTVDKQARMQLFNTSIQAACCALQGLGIDVFGINCSIGPELMEKAVSEISSFSHLPISVLPNAGMPVSENGRTVYKLSPEDFSAPMKKYVEMYGVNIVGGCCGTGPAHIKELASLVKNLKPKKRKTDLRTFISGPQNIVALSEKSGLIQIGERLNVRGSKKVREAVESGEGGIDYNAIDEVVRDQAEGLGLGILDVCMDSNVADTKKILPQVIQHVCADFRGALCIDSFDPEALIAGVKAYPGRPMINSISLEDFEDGKSKLDVVVSKTAFFNPVYIALSADNKGPAVAAAEKIRIAGEIIKRCDSYGVKADQLFIDINAFPIGSESDEKINFALESLNAIAGIKALSKGVRTIIGVSNLTNGLAKKPYMRKVLTSVFLDEAAKKGLDAAIVNPDHYTPAENIDKRDYELARRAILQKDMAAFAELENIADMKKGISKPQMPSYESLSPEDRVREKIIAAYRQRAEVKIGGKFYGDMIVSDAAAALSSPREKTIGSLEFINNYLMPAMAELGKRFSAGTISLPHLLRSADLMKQVMTWLEDHMKNENVAMQKKGTVVIGTVYQDVHCIGKDLIKTLLENYGYKVIDLGVQVPTAEFIQSAINEKAVAISASALLVQTSGHMITLAREMKKANLDIALLIGGAPVNTALAAKAAEAGSLRAGELKRDVFYCPSAMDGVNVLERLFSGGKEAMLAANLEKLKRAMIPSANKSSRKEEGGALAKNSPRYHPPKIKPFRKTGHTDINDLKINFKNLKNLNWRMAKEDETVFKKLADKWIRRSKENNWIAPRGISAVFPCSAKGNKLFIYSIDEPDKKIAELSFPSSVENSWFLSVGSKQKDICGFQISTAGIEAEKAASDFMGSGDAESMLYIKGLADRVAEDYAEMLHEELNNIAGIDDKSSRRVSPGYPAIPDMENNKVIYDLLDGANIGITINDAGLFKPESTTAAVVCFNPDSKI
ncbi:MAG: homocysteine S-methyltransferase family protein [Elusimicrobiota bacterium]|nr:homocysteine S-methyltransferase family protein [Elusimicrobiota bacterium]